MQREPATRSCSYPYKLKSYKGRSSGMYCYSTGQAHDNDNTDRTVGCFCQ